MEVATGGVLDWDSKVKDLLPEGAWGLEDEWASEKANLRDLLGHMTGMPRCVQFSFSRHSKEEVRVLMTSRG